MENILRTFMERAKYLALLVSAQANMTMNAFSSHRVGIMEQARILARQTYGTKIKELQELGYIEYYPSYDPRYPSQVRILISNL